MRDTDLPPTHAAARHRFDRLGPCLQGDDGFGHMAGIPGILRRPAFRALPGRIAQMPHPPGPWSSAWWNTAPPRAPVLRDRTYEKPFAQSPRKRPQPPTGWSAAHHQFLPVREQIQRFRHADRRQTVLHRHVGRGSQESDPGHDVDGVRV